MEVAKRPRLERLAAFKCHTELKVKLDIDVSQDAHSHSLQGVSARLHFHCFALHGARVYALTVVTRYKVDLFLVSHSPRLGSFQSHTHSDKGLKLLCAST